MHKFDMQREYFRSGKTKSYEFRKKQLKILKEGIKKYENHLLDALNKDLGKSRFEGYATEIGTVYEEINYHLHYLKRWMRPKHVPTPLFQFGASSKIYPEPKGVVLIIAPWNYPFNLSITPLVGAISAGNTSLVKLSSSTPNVNDVITDLLKEFFAIEHIAMIQGGNNEVMGLIDKGVDHIFFTGSPNIGKKIMQAASKNLTPVTLELGGKSPAIVTQSADIKKAACRIAWGKYLNAGQTCICPDHVFVHEQVQKDFIKEVIKHIKYFYGNNPKESDDFGRIINEKQFDRILSYIDYNKVVYGGKVAKQNLYISPTIMKDVTYNDKVMQDEIFGPIMPILTYNNFESVIEEIALHPRPLAAYIFTSNRHEEKRVVEDLRFGGGCVNDTIMHISNIHLPFGGNGNSGMGAYHGKKSFDTLSHYKSILKKTNLFNIKLAYPPYKDKLKLLKRILK